MLGRTITHSLFERLHLLGLFGMNIGGGSDYSQSGERTAARIVRDRLAEAGLSKNLILFDVGAHVGGYAAMLSEIFEEKGTTYSFEPSAHTFADLSARHMSNQKIKLFNFGFGDQDEMVSFYSDANGSELASIYHRDLSYAGMSMNLVERVEIKQIDTFCSDQKISHVHFLKLDVEGHELKALAGAKKLLAAGSIDFIQFEFGPANIDSRTFFRDLFFLLKDRYRIYRVMRDGLKEIEEYKETYESFVTTNYLAEKR